jgi:hypothetical protein
MHNGLSVATYNLNDVGPDDGGFACVPGTCLYQQRQLTVHRMFLS